MPDQVNQPTNQPTKATKGSARKETRAKILLISQTANCKSSLSALTATSNKQQQHKKENEKKNTIPHESGKKKQQKKNQIALTHC